MRLGTHSVLAPPASLSIIRRAPARAPESWTPGLGLGARSHPEILVPRVSNVSPFEARPMPWATFPITLSVMLRAHVKAYAGGLRISIFARIEWKPKKEHL